MTDPVDIVPALSDNYIYLLHVGESGAIAVDPGEAAPIIAHLESEGRCLTHILITHHHYDHTGGNSVLKERYACEVIGPDDQRVPELDRVVCEGDSFELGPYEIQVLETPGHTTSHISFFFPRQGIVFPGDTLFLGGCGRLFEGDAATMWQSLQKLMRLPDETRVYCGHEYTAGNLRFAASLEPDNQSIQSRIAAMDAKCSMPGTLAEEKVTNPFLRVEDPLLMEALGMTGASPVEVFAKVRALKDQF